MLNLPNPAVVNAPKIILMLGGWGFNIRGRGLRTTGFFRIFVGQRFSHSEGKVGNELRVGHRM